MTLAQTDLSSTISPGRGLLKRQSSIGCNMNDGADIPAQKSINNSKKLYFADEVVYDSEDEANRARQFNRRKGLFGRRGSLTITREFESDSADHHDESSFSHDFLAKGVMGFVFVVSASFVVLSCHRALLR
eukprot:Rmarinus@m.4798